MQNIEKIRVELENRSYDILIGANAIESLTNFLDKKKYSKIFIITDENVARLHLARLGEVVAKSTFEVEISIAKAGEQTKSFQYLEQVCEEILAKEIDRKSLIIAFGGGVVGDLAGFVASIMLRGIDFIQIPTTLLAAVDSSVGGKTAVNSKYGKNLIGSFYQPQLVICDLNFLTTLSKREFLSGYAEVLKYGLIRDKSFFEFLEKNHDKIFAHEEKTLKYIITESCKTKAEIVGRDEKESGERALLNFGHTFGHIFETETNYSDEILHGEAVAMGMLMAVKMSLNYEMINEDEFSKIKLHLDKCSFVIDPKKVRKMWNKQSLISHVYKDKKNENKNLTFILLTKIGDAVVKKSVPLADFVKVLEEFL